MASYRGSGTSNLSDVWTTFHFYVEGGSNDALSQAVFTEVSGLEVEIEVTKIEEGGVNDHWHSLLGRAKVSDITLKNGIMTDNSLWDWFREILEGRYIRRHVTITMVSQVPGTSGRGPRNTHTWHFANALPVKWSGPQLKADSTALAIQSLVLTHEGLILTTPTQGQR
jgi:phage tail-like protein